MTNPRAVRTLAAALAVAILAGCAGSTGVAPSTGGAGDGAAAASAAAEPLECTSAGYACSWSEVSADVVERSRALASEVTDRIAGGATIEATAEWLVGQQSVAWVETGPEVLRFLLDDGRPVWVSASASADAVATAAGRHGMVASLGGLPAAPRDVAPPARVVGEGREDKKALVLAPFGYETSMEAGEIAGLLGTTRGYEGRVTYLENVTPESTNVGLSTFAQLDGYDVVYLDSFGGTTTGRRYEADGSVTEVERHGFIAVRGPVSDDFHLAEGQEVGVEIVQLHDGKWYLAASADFFTALYPGGLPKALLFLHANDVVDQKLIRSIKGGTSELYAWNMGLEDLAVARSTVTRYVEELADSGRSTAVVYHEMVESMTLANGASFVGYTPIDKAGLRIRETAWVSDPDAGGPLSDGAEITILGEFGDGKADTVPWAMDVDGVDVPTDEPSHTSVAFYIDGVLAYDGLVAELEEIDTGTFRAEGEFELDRDLTDGTQLELMAVVNLPDGGTSRHTLTVGTTDSPRPDIGTVWEGQATAISDTIWPGVKVTRSAIVTFTRDHDEEWDDEKVDFLVTDGTMSWKVDGSSETCSFSGEAQIDLDRGDDTGLTFDRGDPKAITYFGDAGVANGPEIVVSVVCTDGADRSYVTRVEGEVWLAPLDDMQTWTMSGSLIAGSYRRDSALATTYTWSFARLK